jgi:23S rRNA (uracil1939-C5)-methyltransferase
MEFMDVNVTLTTLTYGGEALGRLEDGRAVFVPFALPGEVVRARLVEEKRSHARADLVEVLEPSARRIAPRCAHFGVCGGCHYQHMTYKDQLAAKTAILREQLERIGRFSDPPVKEAVASPETYHYRNHVQFHLTPQGQLGYIQRRPEQVFAVRECHLPEEPINAAWPQLEFEPGSGLERVALRLGVEDDLQLILEGRDPQPPELNIEELRLSAVHLSPAGALVLAGSEYVVMEVAGRLFRVSAGSFFQVNTPMAAAMVEHLLANLSLRPGSTVLDVYCGVGLFSAFLAPRAGRLVAIEASPSAAEDFVANLDEFDNVELYEAPAEQVLPQLDLQPDAIILDPPRAGLGRVVLEAVMRLQAPVVAYVSCDPSTLARDARRLAEGGYHLVSITPFDLFPQTYHIESISTWSREK